MSGATYCWACRELGIHASRSMTTLATGLEPQPQSIPNRGSENVAVFYYSFCKLEIQGRAALTSQLSVYNTVQYCGILWYVSGVCVPVLISTMVQYRVYTGRVHSWNS